ncbi:MAG TPA: glycosyl transferase family 2, partial [Gammaproteobacteria bacterium]|nr:glycosyl transferase family 2 [Gammaproteobacteria bacterium]
LSGYSIWRLRRFIQRKPDIDPPYFLRDLFANSVLTKGFSIK